MKNVLLTAVFILSISLLGTAQNKKVNLPEGAIIKDGKVTAMKNFKFMETESGEVNLYDNVARRITGSFVCQCTGDGGCLVVITGSEIICNYDANSICKGSCRLMTSIDPPKTNDSKTGISGDGRAGSYPKSKKKKYVLVFQ